VDDVAPNGYAVDRATVRQRKTGRPVRFELTEQTRQAIDDHIGLVGKKPGEFLFTGRRPGQGMTTRQYARLLPTFVVEAPSSPLPQGDRLTALRITEYQTMSIPYDSYSKGWICPGQHTGSTSRDRQDSSSLEGPT
jgi:hypothetical protein